MSNTIKLICEHCDSECTISYDGEEKPFFCPFCSEENLENGIVEYDDDDFEDDDDDDFDFDDDEEFDEDDD